MNKRNKRYNSEQPDHSVLCQKAVAILRNHYKLSLLLISELSGYSSSYISHVCNGDYNGSCSLAKALEGLVSKFEDQLLFVAASSNGNCTVDESIKRELKRNVFEALANYPRHKIEFISLPRAINATLIRIKKSNLFLVVITEKTKSKAIDQLIHELKAIKGLPTDDEPDTRRHKPEF